MEFLHDFIDDRHLNYNDSDGEEDAYVKYWDQFRRDRPEQTGCIQGHLNSPIVNEECDFLLRRVFDKNFFLDSNGKKSKDVCFRHFKLASFIMELTKKNPSNLESIYNEKIIDPIGWVQNWVLENTKVNRHHLLMNLTAIKECAELLVKIHYININEPEIKSGQLMDTDLEDVVTKIFSNAKSDESDSAFLQDLYIDMKKIEKFKDEVCFKEIIRGNCEKFEGSTGLRMYYDPDVVFIEFSQGKFFILPTTLLLCSLDKVQCQWPLFTYWKFCDSIRKYPGCSIFSVGKNLFETFNKMRSIMRTDFFSLMSTWESYMIGWVIKHDPDFPCLLLYETQLSDINQILGNNNLSISEIDGTLPNIENRIQTRAYLELLGINKCFGYPTLHPDHLLDQVKNYGIIMKFNPSTDTLRKIEGIMRRDLCINYKAKHGKYPNFTMIPKDLSNILIGNHPVPISLMKDYYLWQQVVFSKTLNYDFTPDQTELVKDSAAAPPLNYWPSMYDQCAFKDRYNKKCPIFKKEDRDKFSTRTIESFLRSDEDHIYKLINKVEHGIYDENDHIAVQCPKERELKGEGGRAFTKQTPDQRFRQTSMEYNISHQIFNYVPEQSMVAGEISNTLRMLSHIKELGHDSVKFSLDLKKWCNYQRASTTAFCSRILDELFGLKNVYFDSHNYFISCNMFVNNRMCPPDYTVERDGVYRPEEGPYFLRKNRGGLEGLQQKKWTMVAASCIKFVIESFESRAISMGQGDNQIIILSLTKEKTKAGKERLISDFLKKLETVFREINHELKDKETWYATRFYEYGKFRFYYSAAISQGTKKAVRLMPDINDGLFSIPSSISTLNTMTEAISRGDSNPICGFIMNQLLVINYLYRKNMGVSIKTNNIDKTRMLIMMLWPSDFGGLPLSSLFSHSVRGHDDKLTLWLSIYKTIKVRERLSDLSSGIEYTWQTYPSKTPKTWEERKRLYMDPYCLNITSLPSADNIIKDLTVKYLQGDEVTNPMIKRLYDPSVSVTGDSLFEALDNFETVQPAISYELLNNSNYGLMLRLRSKLTSSKTVERLIKNQEKVSLVCFINQKNNELKTAVNNKLLRNNMFSEIIRNGTCITKIAEELRNENWNKDIVFITKPPTQCQLTVINPEEESKFYQRGRCIMVKVNPNCKVDSNSIGSEFGPYKPYIGSSTETKMVKPTLDFSVKTNVTKALNNLKEIRGWCIAIQWKDMEELCTSLMVEKLKALNLPFDIQTINDLTVNIISGNIVHRFQTQADSSSAVINSSPTIATHFCQSSNLLRDMTKEGQDYTIFYQLIMVRNMAVVSLNAQLMNKVSDMYLCELSCLDCTKEIDSNVLLKVGNCKNPTIKVNDVMPIPVKEAQMLNILSITKIQLKSAYSFNLGCQMGSNIDDNYTLYHSEKLNHKKHITGSINTDISLNDFKAVNLEYFLLGMVINSKHCLRIISCPNTLGLLHATDYSFTHCAELIGESGRITELISLLDVQVMEHTSITKYQSLSCLIAKLIPRFIKNRLQLANSLTFNVLFEDYTELEQIRYSQLVRHIVTINSKLKKQNLQEKLKIKRLLQGQYMNDLRNIFCKQKTKIVIPSTCQEIQTLWRENRTGMHEIPVIWQSAKKVKIHYDYQGGLDFPFSSLVTYHQDRNKYKNESGVYLPHLSFLSRRVGSISSAGSKYIECFLTVGLSEKQLSGLLKGPRINKTIYCIAEGSGGTLATLGKWLKRTSLAYNTLMHPSIDLRDNPTDNDPPAFVNHEGLKERLIGTQNTLVEGNTDILSSEWRIKFDNSMKCHPPFIVTMDAESMEHGSNMDFVEALIPMILSYLPEVVIFKMFLEHNSIRIHTDNIMKEAVKNLSKAYTWTILKPISSNPCGTECFLTVVNEELLTESQIKYLKTLEPLLDYCTPFVRESRVIIPGFSGKTLDLYVDLSRKIGRLLENEGQDLILTSKYQELIEQQICCSAICIKYIQLLCDQIDYLHNLSRGDDGAYILIRRSGNDNKIEQLIKELIFIWFTFGSENSTGKIVPTITSLNSIEIMKDVYQLRYLFFKGRDNYPPLIRFNTTYNGPIENVKEGEGMCHFLQEFSDKKFMIRDLFYQSSRCPCSPYHLYNTKEGIERSLSSWIIKNHLYPLRHMGFIRHKTQISEWKSEKPFIPSQGCYNYID